MKENANYDENKLSKLERFLNQWKFSDNKKVFQSLLRKEHVLIGKILSEETHYRSLLKEGSCIIKNRFLSSPFVFFRKRPIEDDISDLLGKHLQNKIIVNEVLRETWGGMLLYHILKKLQDITINDIESVKKGHFTVSLRNSQYENIDILIRHNKNDWIIGIENKRDNYEESKGQTKREWKALKEKNKNPIGVFLDEKNRFPEEPEFKRLSYYNLALALNDFKNELSIKKQTLAKTFSNDSEVSLLFHNIDVFIDLIL